MEGAETGEILPGLFQAHVFADDADNVRLLLHALGEGTGFSHVYRNSKFETRNCNLRTPASARKGLGKWKIENGTPNFRFCRITIVSSQFHTSCGGFQILGRTNIPVQKLDNADSHPVEVLVSICCNVSGVECRRQMVAELVNRAATLPAELKIFLERESSVSFGKICRD